MLEAFRALDHLAVVAHKLLLVAGPHAFEDKSTAGLAISAYSAEELLEEPLMLQTGDDQDSEAGLCTEVDTSLVLLLQQVEDAFIERPVAFSLLGRSPRSSPKRGTIAISPWRTRSASRTTSSGCYRTLMGGRR